jgi:hypothetical protein
MSLYVHPENQNMLWSAISKSVLFQNLGTDKESWFRSVIQQMHDRTPSVTDTEHLTKMNKDTILVMLDVLKNNQSPQSNLQTTAPVYVPPPNTPVYVPQSNAQSYSNLTQNQILEPPNRTYTHDYAAQQKQNEIDAHYKHLQSQYQTMLTRDTPAQISFKEPALDEPITNMNELIEKHRAERAIEMLKYAPPAINSNTQTPLLKIDNQTTSPPPVIENIVVFDSGDTPNMIKKSVHWEKEGANLEELFAKWKVELLTDIRSEIVSTIESVMQKMSANQPEKSESEPLDLLDS